MTALTDVCDLARRICAGTEPDTRPDDLKAITGPLPTCERYVRCLYHWAAKVQPKLIVETGTDAGRGTIHLAKGSPSSKVVTVDSNKACTEYVRRMALPNVVAVTEDSPETSRRFADGSIGILFLDSDHSYRHVQRELQAFLPKMQSGAIVFMDDLHLKPEMERLWNEITYPKREVSDLHFTGFGVFEVP